MLQCYKNISIQSKRPYQLRLSNILKDFQINNMKKTRSKGVVNDFSVDYNVIDTNDVSDIHKYLMKETWFEIMFEFIFKIYLIID